MITIYALILCSRGYCHLVQDYDRMYRPMTSLASCEQVRDIYAPPHIYAKGHMPWTYRCIKRPVSVWTSAD